ncbi:glycosyltransferase family 4 protein [Blastochloris viridis]|uniref:Capsular glucan synthase n=1 Tax=Blastochloris viridis TaxID=1079 RepID=A0A0H5BNP4_BLAVI|nr:glycosyltransferase family 4 protein [Blastochloris viridis]ALK08711.1 N,N'-diacetylbacillosaminyl-diphospho-undecaprenol alpha-1,3-N-acetylgalactosaminyltransferase [Blastochloris viridis]BAR97993.1 lipid carrier : UDP-N-acetylgalactosaminyltransferase [Blastochloris viridis]CUU41373.1 Capsular glucan synthase [Blastochloris viridis]
MSAPRLVYLVTEDWYFISHRMPMARAAKAAGYEVHVVTRVDRHGAAIEAEGFILHPTDLRRGSIRPHHLLAAVAAVRARYRDIRPALAHHVALQSVVVGSLAAIGLSIPAVNALTGLGAMFTAQHGVARSLTAWLLLKLLPLLLTGNRSLVLVQNPDDRDAVERLGVKAGRVAMVPGSGVDVDWLQPSPEPAGPVTVAYVGRMLDDKGVRTLIEAHRKLRASGQAPRLLLAGQPDPSNPASIPAAEVEGWAREPGVEWLGHVSDIRTVWKRAHIGVLASRREGLPLSLLEAAACGRALIATDTPGCREVARHGVNALTFPVDDADALAAAIQRLAGDPGLRAAFAAESRRLAVEVFAAERIGRDIVELYQTVSRLPELG